MFLLPRDLDAPVGNQPAMLSLVGHDGRELVATVTSSFGVDEY